MNCKKVTHFFGEFGGLLTRVVVGIIFLVAGYGKLFGAPGIEGFSGFLTSMGFPIPMFFAVIVGVVELLGGAFLIVGLFTKQISKLLAIIILVAIITVHINLGSWSAFWSEIRYPLLLFFVLLTYIGHAPTKCALDMHVCKKHKPAKSEAKPVVKKRARKTVSKK